ncbi:MAG: UDP-N-acetylmuramoyl-L-alanyl-D-glutamate--2,6-diaminopimelate ligase [Gammaproteobacteria bacterium]
MTAATTWHRSLTHLLDGIVEQNVPECAIEFVTMDSRLVKPGSLFLATNGIKRHGLEFAQQAFANGAVAILFEPAKGVVAPFAPPGKIVLAVNHLSAHIGVIAARFFDEPSLDIKVCGVTGTNGKSTVTHLIASALHLAGQRCGQMGTLGFGLNDPLTKSDMTTPDAVSVQQRLGWLREQRATHVAMEVSSHALDQHRVNGVAFDVAVFTNLSRDHLDYHADLDEYATAKKRLFEQFPITHAVINADDALGRELIQSTSLQTPVTVVSAQGPESVKEARNLIRAVDIETHADGLAFNVSSAFGTGRVQSTMLGNFNVLNLISALGVLLHWGVPFDQALAALGRVKAPAGRMESFGREDGARFVVDFAHTPDALANAIKVLRQHCKGQLWVVFGCGGDRDRGKRPQMAAAAQSADRVIVTNDNPRYEDPDVIISEIMPGFSDASNVVIQQDRSDAIEYTIENAGPDDVVLIAGKGHEDYQLVGGERIELCDRGLVNQFLQQVSVEQV